MGDVITVGAIDDDRMLLEMLKNWMSAVPDIELMHTAATVDDYVQLGVSNQIVLLDLNLKDDSSPAENVVRLTGLGSKVLVVSIIADQQYVIATLEAGAEGYLTKNHGPDALVISIRQIAAGELPPSQELAFAVTRDNRPTRPHLSPQEGRLLSYYARGMTLDAAARKIGVSPRTAEDYLSRVKKNMRKLAVLPVPSSNWPGGSRKMDCKTNRDCDSPASGTARHDTTRAKPTWPCPTVANHSLRRTAEPAKQKWRSGRRRIRH